MKTTKKYAVVASYEYNGYKRNEVISRHATYELAERAIKRGPYQTFRSVREIDGDRIK
jgi:hypothetical protein